MLLIMEKYPPSPPTRGSERCGEGEGGSQVWSTPPRLLQAVPSSWCHGYCTPRSFSLSCCSPILSAPVIVYRLLVWQCDVIITSRPCRHSFLAGWPVRAVDVPAYFLTSREGSSFDIWMKHHLKCLVRWFARTPYYSVDNSTVNKSINLAYT